MMEVTDSGASVEPEELVRMRVIIQQIWAYRNDEPSLCKLSKDGSEKYRRLLSFFK